MALPIKQQAAIWGGIIAVFLALLWFLGDVILPFLTGGAIAYFLDPLADRLEKWGLGRAAATTVISLVALLVVVAGIFVIVPLLVAQATALIQSAPQIFSELQAFLTQQFPSLMDDGSPLRQSLISVGQTIQARGGELLNTALSSAINVVNAIVFMVVVPVVAFYMLLDWDHMVARIDELLPRDHRPVIRQIAADVDRTLAGFRARSRHSVSDLGHILCHRAHGRWFAIWACSGFDCRAFDLYPLCWRFGGGAFIHRACPFPILGRLVEHRRHRNHLSGRTDA